MLEVLKYRLTAINVLMDVDSPNVVFLAGSKSENKLIPISRLKTDLENLRDRISLVVQGIHFRLFRGQIIVAMPENAFQRLGAYEEVIFKASRSKFRAMRFISHELCIIAYSGNYTKSIFIWKQNSLINAFVGFKGELATKTLTFSASEPKENIIQRVQETISLEIPENYMKLVEQGYLSKEVIAEWKEETELSVQIIGESETFSSSEWIVDSADAISGGMEIYFRKLTSRST